MLNSQQVMMKERKEILFLQPSNSLPAALSKSGSTNKNAVVGFDEKLSFLTVDLTQGSSELEVISIAGIPGLGKTTLARQIYDSSVIASHFDLRAWVTVSQEFREQEVLERLLNSIRDVNHESRHESIEKLAENIYKSLKDKRYLLVIDDVWDIEAVNKVKSWIPRDDNGSRILLTTQNVGLAELTNPKRGHHRIPFLSDEESWDLLREMVFGKGPFLPKLNGIGKRIAHKCCGLPLVVVVIGGLLYKAGRTLAYWEYVARKLGSLYDIQDILSFSYNQLPHHLRACFLYMGVFPEDHEIRRSKLTKLWVANRFIKPDRSKSLEEVAEEYLRDLVDRNLIMVREWSYSGEIKTCCIHDAMRYFCLKKAREIIISDVELLPEVHDNLRHVSVLTDWKNKILGSQNRELRVRCVTFFFAIAEMIYILSQIFHF